MAARHFEVLMICQYILTCQLIENKTTTVYLCFITLCWALSVYMMVAVHSYCCIFKYCCMMRIFAVHIVAFWLFLYFNCYFFFYQFYCALLLFCLHMQTSVLLLIMFSCLQLYPYILICSVSIQSLFFALISLYMFSLYCCILE